MPYVLAAPESKREKHGTGCQEEENGRSRPSPSYERRAVCQAASLGPKFLHEAPWAATSWKDEKVEALAEEDGVFVVKGPMCRWQMMATDRRGLQGTGYVRKETGWMTNDEGLARVLQ